MTKKKLKAQYNQWLHRYCVCPTAIHTSTPVVVSVRDWHVSSRYMISEAIYVQCLYGRNGRAHIFVYAERITWLLDESGNTEKTAARTYQIISNT